MNQPKKTVSATEIKNRFGYYLDWVVKTKEPLLIERHGKPVLVMVEFSHWERLEKSDSGKAIKLVDKIKDAIDEFS